MHTTKIKERKMAEQKEDEAELGEFKAFLDKLKNVT